MDWVCFRLTFEINIFCYAGSVFCCDVDQSGSGLAVSGGEDDKAYIWNMADGAKVTECTGR